MTAAVKLIAHSERAEIISVSLGPVVEWVGLSRMRINCGLAPKKESSKYHPNQLGNSQQRERSEN